MALLIQQAAASIVALMLALSCARVDDARSANSAPAAPFLSAEPVVLSAEDQTEDALALTRRSDSAGRGADSQLPKLTPQEHMRRAAIYHVNRAFEEARAHWRTLIERYPDDPNVPAAHFGIGRTLYQERRYAESLPVFQKLGETYPGTLAGRDGFYYVAAALLRVDRAGDAAARYIEYTERYPNGERIENAYSNAIDSLREAGRPDEAIKWIELTRARFRGKDAETSAVFARLRLDVARSDWPSALRTGDELSRMSLTRAVNTTSAEVAYLRAFSLEQSGRKDEAIKAYQGIGDGAGAYFGWLATSRLHKLGAAAKASASIRENRVAAEVRRAAGEFPAPFRDSVVRASKQQKIDPRFVLSIMRQESGFKASAKSGAGARGLLQMTPDMAVKYAPSVKLSNVREEDLYKPDINILVGSAYLSELHRMFPDLPEAVAASYNGGEDNVARWVVRAVHKDPGLFTAEVGFTETKDYVNKVMANYRAYKILYTEDLKLRR
ncbi:MAG TPA: transglycosylase SLT domain-containing protein [Pyrinomonadaceae bacterium]|nr:transglycosylase SLT domain-containing protein [Pyrinomonadaceae bacterium]